MAKKAFDASKGAPKDAFAVGDPLKKKQGGKSKKPFSNDGWGAGKGAFGGGKQ